MYSNSFRYNQSYPGIIQAYSDIFRTPCNPGVFRTRDIFRTLAYSVSEAYSEACQRSMREHFTKTVNDYNYLHKL